MIKKGTVGVYSQAAGGSASDDKRAEYIVTVMTGHVLSLHYISFFWGVSAILHFQLKFCLGSNRLTTNHNDIPSTPQVVLCEKFTAKCFCPEVKDFCHACVLMHTCNYFFLKRCILSSGCNIFKQKTQL